MVWTMEWRPVRINKIRYNVCNVPKDWNLVYTVPAMLVNSYQGKLHCMNYKNIRLGMVVACSEAV